MALQQPGYVVYDTDNVGTALENLIPGPIRRLGSAKNLSACALQDIPRGHKFALTDIHAGDAILKYGARIGTATAEIRKGAHVHLHNMSSDFDERSGTLDVESAVPTDIEYRLHSFGEDSI